jgi:3-deoxy-manno-octulosonate cytidylyltransferase (CMP-KDO synthetase)
MRILEHGGKVRMVPTTHATYSVDTPADLERIEQIMRESPR